MWDIRQGKTLRKSFFLLNFSFLFCLDFIVQVNSNICLPPVLTMGYVTAVMVLTSGKSKQLEEMCYRNTTSMSNMHHVETSVRNKKH